MYGSQNHKRMLEMFEKELGRDRDDGFEIEPDVPSGDDNDNDNDEQQSNQPPKKRSYRRHTQHQIQEMEVFFKHCPHPDDKQRKELGLQLGLEPLQVKFWFQNKRTQLKVQSEREENEFLKAEIEKLRSEMNRYKEAISNTTCHLCGTPATVGEMSYEEQQLRLENALLRKEIERLAEDATESHTNISSTQTSNQLVVSRSVDVGNGKYNINNGMVGEAYGGNGELVRSIQLQGVEDKRKIVELAVLGMDELTKLALANGNNLWLPNNNLNTEILNEDEYVRHFPRATAPKPLGLRTDGSRESVVVIMNHINLIDILMDVNRWSSMFSGVVSRAVTLKVLSTGVAGNYNGALQVMSAEFQVPSPFVPSRENYFVRYCKLHVDGVWAVVDVSLDSLRPAASGSSTASRTQRRPSGCFIQELPNGYSKVTWIEHVEVDDKMVQNIYKPLVDSGLAYGAKRWVAILQRQCERLACSMSSNMPTGNLGVIMSVEGRKSMLNLAERMVTSFSTSIGDSTIHAWTSLPSNGPEDIRVMTKKYNDEPGSGRPTGVVLSTVTSFWLPVPPKRLFDFLRNQNSRSQWDILSSGGIVQEMAHIANGHDPGNCVSLLRVNSPNIGQSNMLILQESSTDITGSYVIYAPVDMAAMNVVLNGGDSNCVALLPSGFAIVPDGSGPNGGPIPDLLSGGSLLTVAFHILVDSVPNARLALGSVTTVNTLIKSTVERIKVAVIPNIT